MTGVIILAAGQSGRLGQPKQNLVFNGQTLLQRAVNAARRSQCSPVIVVLGANSDQINTSPDTITLYNKDWKEGMASSIRIGINELKKDSSVNKAIIMLCDQPFVNVELLNSLIDKQTETGKSIIACEYNGVTGVPVLFDRTLFEELLLLRGYAGAKKILSARPNDVATIPFEHGGIDIDTPADYERLRGLSD